MKITIYTKSACPNCVAAKQLLKSKRLEYEEVELDPHGVILEELLSTYPDARQMPQIFINDQRVGGFAGLQQALKELGL
jgi:glutaredoxin 3